jgi:capsular exopolysaccharide synthesis family protein
VASRIFTLPGDRQEFSAIAECFRILRTNLQYSSNRHDGEAKVFVFTSALPGEGKTFTASNLIVSLADAGKKCLIINCDLRKPALGKIFGIKNQVGLVNVLVGEARFEEVVRRHLFELPLDVLLCGPIPPNPSKLLLGDDFRNLLARLKKEYDYIFLDAPPCLTLADTSILAPLCEGVVFVVQAGRTDSNVSLQALNQLRQLNFNIVGVVLNRFSVKEAGSFGYRDYSYYGNGSTYSYTPGRFAAFAPPAINRASSLSDKVGQWFRRRG